MLVTESKKENIWQGMLMALIAVVIGMTLMVGGCGRLDHRDQLDSSGGETGIRDMGSGDTLTEEEIVQEPSAVQEQPAEQTEVAAAREVPVYRGSRNLSRTLPASYDAREVGRTSPVKDQGDLGTCWAFASLLALESTLLPEERMDFSEDHMSNNPSFNLKQEDGGEYTMAMAYLLSWKGPVLEEMDPYGDGFSPDGLEAVKHVQEIQILPSRDLDAIKRAVYSCGGVQSSLYTTLRSSASESKYYNRDTRAYCYPEDTAPNHDVVIVGWNDEFPAEAFSVEVAGNGAFLCENSWGSQFGEDGFFYVSYYDANIGKNNILYSSVEDKDHYDSIYQSDLCGWIGQLGYGGDTAWAVNVYTAGGSETLEAVGFYATAKDTVYEVYGVHNVPERPSGEAFAERLMVAEGTLDYAGFYTVPLTEEFLLKPGERYGVMIRLTTPDVIHPIAIEYDAGDGKCKVDLEDGEGYISLEGEQWQHVETEQRCNLCLKAYTCDN